MKILCIYVGLLLSILRVSSLWSYIDLTPAEVYSRLVNSDSLLLLDVREVSEYLAGHIAEPEGQLPLTPVNMPFASGVLLEEYNRLPTDIDIIVYCQSGGRSASASSLLETKGFTHIYNMTSGFSSWIYDYRTNGFGDHSGQWIHASDDETAVITCSVNRDTNKIIFPAKALPNGIDSLYIEIHFASSRLPVPPDVFNSDLAGLFRITVLDRFGLSPFIADSVNLSDSVYISLIPKYQSHNGVSITHQNMKVYVPIKGWKSVSYYADDSLFYRAELILRKWYNIEGFITSSKNKSGMILNKFILNQNYPNPFNPKTVICWQIATSSDANLSVYNMLGQKVVTLVSERQLPGRYKIEWNAGAMASGTYYYRLIAGNFVDTKKLVVLK